MSDIKHTPGPWHVGATEVKSNEDALSICKENIDATKTPGTHFYEVYVDSGHRTALVGHGPTNHWNALLIAAAPELLEALKEAIETIKFLSTRDNSWGEQIVCEDLQAIVAKATGSQS